MKKLILTITVAAFTVGAYAGDKCCSKDKAACSDKDKAACAEKAAAGCPMSNGKCQATAKTAKQNANKKVVQSPKGAEAARS
jgi:hypothetical protein